MLVLLFLLLRTGESAALWFVAGSSVAVVVVFLGYIGVAMVVTLRAKDPIRAGIAQEVFRDLLHTVRDLVHTIFTRRPR